MKTLDEVIDMAEKCAQYPDCEGCIYSVLNEPCGGTWANDALHYLKMFRDMTCGTSQNFADTSQITCPKCHSEFVILPEANNPLTWNELKQMEGKPVWVEALLYKQWAVIAYIGDEYIRFEGANLYAPECRTYMGADNGWKAYRKERSCT